MRLPEVPLDDRDVPGPRQRGPDPHRPELPGVDRAQRLRPRHHADRAVRLDDRDGHLPAQPDPRQAARGADGAARDHPRAAHRGARRAALPPRGAGDRAGLHPGGGTEVGTLRTPSDESIVFQTRRGLHHPGRAAHDLRRRARPCGQGRRRRRRRRAAEGPRPAPVRRARRSSATRSTSASSIRSVAPADAARRRLLAGARRGRRPRGPAAALGDLVREGPGGWAECDVLLDTHRRLQLRHRRSSSCSSRRDTSRSAWAASAGTGCAAGSTTGPAPARRPRRSPTRPRSTRSPPRRSARSSPSRTP